MLVNTLGLVNIFGGAAPAGTLDSVSSPVSFGDTITFSTSNFGTITSRTLSDGVNTLSLAGTDTTAVLGALADNVGRAITGSLTFEISDGTNTDSQVIVLDAPTGYASIKLASGFKTDNTTFLYNYGGTPAVGDEFIAKTSEITLFDNGDWIAPGVGTTTIYGIDATDWVMESFDLITAVLSVVNIDQVIQFDILNNISSDSLISWSIVNEIIINKSINYSILNNINSDKSVLFNVLNSVQSDQLISWNVAAALTQVLSDLQLSYDLLNNIDSDLAASWAVLNNITDDLPISWDLVQLILTDQNLSWDVQSSLSSVVSDLAINWNILQFINNSLLVNFDILNAVNNDNIILWNISQLVTADLLVNWDIKALSQVLSDLQVEWNLLESSNSDLTIQFSIASEIFLSPKRRRLLKVVKENRVLSIDLKTGLLNFIH